MKLFKTTFIFQFAMEGKRTSICMASMLILLAAELVLASIASSAAAVHAQSNTAKNSTTLTKDPISTGAGNAAEQNTEPK
jgi:hypothetical protein